LTPYYEQDGITIYHGDCRDVLPQLPKVGHVLTDPPYGIGASSHQGSVENGWRDYGRQDWDSARPSRDLVAEVIAKAEHAIVWGANYMIDALPWEPKHKWLIWDKGQSDFSLADAELAWCSWDGAIRRLVYARALALKDGKQHPTQKPVEIMTWCLTSFPNFQHASGPVLDPFMGSGTTLVAAKKLNWSAIGIEREERYCEIAAQRLSQGALPMEFSA
jgi:DNA modification methylase